MHRLGLSVVGAAGRGVRAVAARTGTRAARRAGVSGLATARVQQRRSLTAAVGQAATWRVRMLSSAAGDGMTKKEFKAETAQLLKIVAQSLYTDTEVFVRELVSNASDSLSKLAHLELASNGGDVAHKDLDREIRITVDADAGTFMIEDTGVGMTADDLEAFLGTIASSGSGKFVEKIKEQQGGLNTSQAQDIIGMFGVGFYSVFMVASKVTVHSCAAAPGSQGAVWTSTGDGTYETGTSNEVQRGTKIVLELNDKSRRFANEGTVKEILGKYSSFVGFPLLLNNEQVNTIGALWTMNKNDITRDMHVEFYKFIANAYDEPQMTMQFKTDSPLDIKALFYVPSMHLEKMGLSRLSPGISIYSRKVLINHNAADFMPEWTRFVKGVVDSEDISLNVSRERMQDSSMIRRIADVLTRRLLKFLDEEARKDEAKYESFWKEFQHFLKEGMISDPTRRNDLAKLLRYESSAFKSNQLTSLKAYVERMKADQDEIYFAMAPQRQAAETSPYYEAYKSKGLEVLFLYDPVDEFIMKELGSFEKKKIISIEDAEIKIDEADQPAALNEKKALDLADWIKGVLSDKVATVKTSTRLVDSPVVIVGHESASVRRMMKWANPDMAEKAFKQENLEINPNHPIILRVDEVRSTDGAVAKLVTEQLYDNAMIQAGLVDDPRPMISRVNQLMERAMGTAGGNITEAEVTEIKN